MDKKIGIEKVNSWDQAGTSMYDFGKSITLPGLDMELLSCVLIKFFWLFLLQSTVVVVFIYYFCKDMHNFHYSQVQGVRKGERYGHYLEILFLSKLGFRSSKIRLLQYHLNPLGGVLPKTWCTGMLKGFEVHFHQFWYTNGVVLKLFQLY